MTPVVLEYIEKLRAAGDLFGTTGLCVARDLAAEHGCRLRVTSRRTVPVRKSNRTGAHIWGSLQPGDSITLAGQMFSVTGKWRWPSDRIFDDKLAADQSDDLVAAIAAAINGSPRGHIMTISTPFEGEELRGMGGGLILHAWSANDERWFSFDPAADVAREVVWQAPPTGQAKLRIERARLQQARPQQRLDGRRRR